MAENNKVVVRKVRRHSQLFSGGWCVCVLTISRPPPPPPPPPKFFLIMMLLRVVVRDAEKVLRSAVALLTRVNAGTLKVLLSPVKISLAKLLGWKLECLGEEREEFKDQF